MFSKLGVYALITKLVLHFFLHAFCGGFFFFCPNLYGSGLYGASKQVLLSVGFVNTQVQLTLQVGLCREEVGG